MNVVSSMNEDMKQMYKMLKTCSNSNIGKLTLDNLCSKVVVDYIDTLNKGIDELITEYENEVKRIKKDVFGYGDLEMGIVQGLQNAIQDLNNLKGE